MRIRGTSAGAVDQRTPFDREVCLADVVIVTPVMGQDPSKRRWVLLVSTLVLLMVSYGASAAADGAAFRPNIVVFVVDDFAHEDLERLPRLRELMFDPGVEFTRFATPNALCGPSRVSILRGQYSHNSGAINNKQVFGLAYDRGLERSTIATWLQDSGYATGLFGKYLNGYGRKYAPVGKTYVPPGWSEWYAGNVAKGYRFWLNENGRVVEFPIDGPHVNDVLAERATRFIGRHASEPMFLYIATGSPHGAARPAHRHESEFVNAGLPQRPSFNEADVSDKPAWIRDLVPKDAASAKRAERHRNRLRAMRSVEELIASVLDALEAEKILDRTFLVFLSDNGFHYGEHRIEKSKASTYDETILVPAAIRGPGVPAGARLSQLVTNADLAVTFAEWGGVAPPIDVDGRSLTPLLHLDRTHARRWRTAIGIEHPEAREHGDGPSPAFIGIRTERWKYVRYLQSGEEELYDLARDPYELQSLHRSARSSCLKAMYAWASNLLLCQGASCRDLERTPAATLACKGSAGLLLPPDAAAADDPSALQTLESRDCLDP